MFVLCPHCQFLVAVDARTGRIPAECPKCGEVLGAQDEVQDVPASIAAEPGLLARAAWRDTPAPAPALVSAAPAPLAPPDALSDAIATIVGHQEPPAAPQLSADAVIAAMAAKPARKPRAKAVDEGTKPAKKPRRTKPEPPATDAAATVEAPKPPPATPPKVHAPLLPRIRAWLASWKPVAKPKHAETKPEPARPAPRPKASVKPIPSLRERAAKRAAAAAEAAAAEAGIAPSPAPEQPAAELATAPNVDVAPVIAPTPIIAPDAIVPPAPRPAPAPAPAFDATPIAPPPSVPAPPVVARRRTATHAPSFLRTRAHSALAWPAHWPQLATIAGLALMLALQLLLAQRDVLAADARWRPVVGGACGLLRCSLPAWRQPDAFTMLSRDVRPHPRAPGTLRIDASFRNDARWSQAWPRLVVSLQDVDGRVVGTRAFTAREYLGATPTQNSLASGQTAAIHLDVIEPAPGIVAFSFDFR